MFLISWCVGRGRLWQNGGKNTMAGRKISRRRKKRSTATSNDTYAMASSCSFNSARALCRNDEGLSESELVSKLEAILKTNPIVVHEDDGYDGRTLLHHAAFDRSPEFCKLLVDMNPDLLKFFSNDERHLSFHLACVAGNVEAAKYLYHIYPESINIPNADGSYPLHRLMSFGRRNQENVIELTQFLLIKEQCLSGTIISVDCHCILLVVRRV